MSEVIKINIDLKVFLESLPKEDDGSIWVNEEIIIMYITEKLTEAGIQAEAQYQDTDWSISMKEEKYYMAIPCYDSPIENLLSAIRYFSDEVNKGNDFEAWYSFCNKEHFLVLKKRIYEKT